MSSTPPPSNLLSARIPEPVLAVLKRLREARYETFLVGGCVRDMVRGEQPKDYDIATNARPEDVEHLFRKVIPTGRQHGTMTVLHGGSSIEVTTFRTEGEYLDGRRPSHVEFVSTIEDDLSRRDFTINAMAYDPIALDLRDPFGGQRDLAAHVIRGVGDPDARFQEDGLRSLRAVRFAAVLGYELDPQTAAAIPRSLPTFRKIATERTREEFSKLLVSARPAFGLELLRTTGLLKVFLPEVLEGVGQEQTDDYEQDVYGHAIATIEVAGPDLTLRLAALLHDVAKPRTAVRKQEGRGFDFPEHEVLGATLANEILERLRFPRKLIDSVASLVRYHRVDRLETASDGELRRFLAAIGEENVAAHFALAEANRRGRSKRVDEALARLSSLRHRIERILASRPALNAQALALDGNAIMQALNVGPSPVVGEATRFLLERVLDDPETNSPEKLTELLRNWAQSKGR